jgi:signal transduction histidine kinase
MMKKYEEEMAYLFNSSNIYSWSYDFCTHIVSFQTDPSHPLFKMSIEELLTFVIKENDETDEHMIERLDAAASHPYTMQLKGKNIFDKEEKSVHIYTISSMPQYDKNDNVCGAFGIWLDITSRMNAREKLKHEMELANQSVRMKSMFMASLSHEIRTPLNSIVGFSEILHTIQDENERKQIFDIIDSNCDILLRLINDILAASDKETNLKIEPKDIEFVKCFKEICQVLKQRVDLSGVEFIMDSPCDEIRARLDIERLQQVLTNFVTNAVKYTKKGHIKVGYEFDGKILYIYCEDTGTGIPKDKQNMVFEQFVKLNDFVQGTGLGLSICKQIVEMSGGEIGVDSTVGKGSTFWMKIPVE